MSIDCIGRELHHMEEMHSTKIACLWPVRWVCFHANVLEREQWTYFLKLMINNLKTECQPCAATYER